MLMLIVKNWKGVRCKGLRCLEQASMYKTKSSRPNRFTGIPAFLPSRSRFSTVSSSNPTKEEQADCKQITLVRLLCKTDGNTTWRQRVFCTYHRSFNCFISNLQLVRTRCIKRTVDLKLVHLATDDILNQEKIVKVEWDTCKNLKGYDMGTANNQKMSKPVFSRVHRSRSWLIRVYSNTTCNATHANWKRLDLTVATSPITLLKSFTISVNQQIGHIFSIVFTLIDHKWSQKVSISFARGLTLVWKFQKSDSLGSTPFRRTNNGLFFWVQSVGRLSKIFIIIVLWSSLN